MKAPTKPTREEKRDERKEARQEAREERKEEKKTLDLYPVRITHNYRPMHPEISKILEVVDTEDGDVVWKERDMEGFPEKLNEEGKVKVCAVGEYAKIWADTVIVVPKDEARRLLRNGKAIRHDDL